MKLSTAESLGASGADGAPYEEEERQRANLFSQTRKNDGDLQALGACRAERKAELMALSQSGLLPGAVPATMK
jgi:hypothetical protein